MMYSNNLLLKMCQFRRWLDFSFPNPTRFVPRNETNFGRFVPWTFRSLDNSFLGRFVPLAFRSYTLANRYMQTKLHSAHTHTHTRVSNSK